MANKVDVKKYRCMNFGACAKADCGEIIEIDAIETLSGKPVCPHCHQDTLEELPDNGGGKKKVIMAAGGVVVAAALGVGGYFLAAGGDKPETPPEPPVVHSVKISKIEVGSGWSVIPQDMSALKSGDTVWVAADDKLSKDEVAKGVAVTVTLEDSTSTATPANVTLTDNATVKVASVDGKLSGTYILAIKKKVEAEKNVEPDGKGKEGEGKPGKVTPPNPRYGTVNLGYGVYTGDLKDGKPHGHGTIKYKRSHKIVSSQEYVAEPGDEFEGNFRNGIPSGGLGFWKHQGDVTGIKL